MSGRFRVMIDIMRGDSEMFEMYFQDDKPSVLSALLAAEDHRGASHSGIDYLSLARVAVGFIFGGGFRGLSTIEQQYARLVERRHGNLFLCKIRELVWARRLSRHLSKEQIWCGYLWRAYFGAHLLGYAAAREFFSPGASALTPAAAAAIVACLKYPRPKMPSSAWDFRHKQRVAYVLRRQMRLHH